LIHLKAVTDLHGVYACRPVEANGMVTVYDELARTWKEEFFACIKVLSQYLTGKNHRQIFVMLTENEI
jgi:hypothetical protein